MQDAPRWLVEKNIPDQFVFTHIGSRNIPFSRDFGILHGLKCVANSSKGGNNTSSGIPNGLGSPLVKLVSQPRLVPKYSIFKELGHLPRAKPRHHGLKTGQNHLFEDPKWSRNNFGKDPLFKPRTLVDSILHQITTSTGAQASRWASLRVGNDKKRGFRGGLGALRICN